MVGDVPVVEGFSGLVEVGRGGFSRVFGAYQVAFDRRVALKVLNERLADDASVAAFERECQAMGGLSRHPFIVTVLASAFTSDYRPCIVMDLFERGNYMQLVRRDGPLPLEELLSLSVRVAGALATAHQAGVIHGDVKPQNIFKSDFGYPALGDFGIATLRNRLVERAGVGLSPHFVAPELVEMGAGAVGAAADQYSLGATIFTLATGRRPFESDSPQAPQQILAHVLEAPAPVLPESFPPDLRAALRRAMAREPRDRFPDLGALAVALANIEHRLGHRPTAIPIAGIDDDATITVDQDTLEALRQQPPTPPPEGPPGGPSPAAEGPDAPTIALTPPQQPPEEPPDDQPPPQDPKRRRRRILLVAVALLLAAAAAVLLTRNQQETPNGPEPAGNGTEEPTAAPDPAPAPPEPPPAPPTEAPAPQPTKVPPPVEPEPLPPEPPPEPPPHAEPEPPPVEPEPPPPAEPSEPTGTEPTPPPPEPAPAPEPRGEGPVKFGFLAGLSGDYSEWGPPSQDGAEAAIGVINASGGILGRDAELVVQDSLSTAEGAVTGYNRIREEIDALGGVESDGAVALLDTVAEDEMPTMCPACGTTVLDTEGGNYIWRISASDTTYGIISAQLARDLGYTRVAMLVQQTEGTESPAVVFKDVWENKIGGEITAYVRFQPGLDSYQAQVEQAFAGNPEAVYIGAGPQAGTPIIREYIARGYDATILVSPDLQVPDIAEAAAELPTGRVLAAHVTDDFESPAYAAFAAAHQEYANKPPPTGFYETNQFDQYIVLALAMTAAESTDGPDVAAQIYNVTNAPGTKVYTYADGVAALERGEQIDYDGPSGSIELHTTTGNLVSPKVAVQHIVNGEFTAREVDAPAEPPPPPPAEDVTAALVFDIDGRGDQSFNDSAAAGLDRAAEFLRVNTTEASPNPDGSNRAELLQLSADGADLVIGVGFLFGESITEVAAHNPDTYFGIIDSFPAELPNLAGLVFAEHEGSFLVGAAAALKSTTGTVGFIGGVDIPLIRRYHAGFEAGVHAVDPNIKILAVYVTEPPDFDGWSQPAEAKIIAQSMYESGADVIYHAAGDSGAGLFEAAKDFSESTGSQVWGIGVDSDQYFTSSEEVRPYILTSMLKRVDVAVYKTIEAVVNGDFRGGTLVFDLSVDGVGYSTTGGFVDDIVPLLESFRQAIVDGSIVVPERTR